MDKYKITIDTWSKIASLYEDKFMDLVLYNQSYDKFLDLISTKDADVLEIACGPGNITKYISQKKPNFNILATDVASSMTKLARKNVPMAKFQVMDCRNIDQIKDHFDGVICGFCVPYLSKEDTSKLILDSFNLLNDQGIFYLSAIEGGYNKSGLETGSTGDGTYVYYYQENDLKLELINNGFKIIEIIKIEYPTGKGSIQTHLIYIAKKQL